MDALLERAVAAQLPHRREPARVPREPYGGVTAAYYLGALVITMTAFHPVFTPVSLMGALACACVQVGARTALSRLAAALPLASLVALANPLFSASGSTLVAKLGPTSVYLESLVWGACLGVSLLATLTWFSCAARALTFDRVLRLGGAAFPVTTLMVSLSARLVPDLVRRGRASQEAARACSAAPMSAVRLATRTANVLVGWALEDSLVTSDSMRARGWGCREGRTTYRTERLCASDLPPLALMAVLFAASAFLAWVACGQFRFYPTLSHLVAWWGYLPWCAYVGLAPAFFSGGAHAARA